MDIPRSALPPGVLSLHILPAEHHDRDWDAIIVPREVKERLLAQALLEQPKMFNHHRGLWGYTGRAADGELLTIQSTGMGGPSAAIVISEPTFALARFVAEGRGLPERVRHEAKRAILNWLGCAIGASRHPG